MGLRPVVLLLMVYRDPYQVIVRHPGLYDTRGEPTFLHQWCTKAHAETLSKKTSTLLAKAMMFKHLKRIRNNPKLNCNITKGGQVFK